MLIGIDPLLTGDLLRILDHMGHGDVLLIADAHYPARSMGAPVLEVATSTPELVRAVRTVLPIDMYEGPSALLMTPEPGVGVEVQAELRASAAVREDRIGSLDRFAFYEAGRSAVAVLRTLETRKYGCLLLRKGVVGDDES